MTDIHEFLEHHGVKGMRWGVRRRRGTDGRVKGSTKPRAHQLSDADLKAAVNRMNMERQYNNLTRGKQGSTGLRRAVVLGASFVSGLAMNVARTQMQNQMNAQVSQAIAQRAERAAADRADLVARAAARAIAGGRRP